MSKKFNQQFACSRMMLPEHRSSLQQHNAKTAWEENHRRPFLDEQRQEELQQLLEQAIFKQQRLNFTVLNNGGYQTITGIPLRSDPAAGFIYIFDAGGTRRRKIMAADVVNLEPP